MSHIRNTIELLSKILRDNGTLKIKAETLRSAKFNQDESAEILWKLLFELLYYCDYGKIDSVTIQACSELSQEEMVVYVKKMLQRRGYYSPEFASLQTNMLSGSRELLLAVGWLLCKENIIQRFMSSCSSPLDSGCFSIKQETAKKMFDPPKWSDNLTDRVKQMLWFNNKTQMNMRVLLAVNKEKALLQHKIHDATYGVTTDPERNHLTVFEVYLLRHPDLLKTNLELLEKDNERLTNLLKWKDHEDIFWKWMESVLDEKLKEKCLDKVSDVSTKGSNTSLSIQNVMEEGISYMVESHHNLQESIMKYEYVVDQLERLWESKCVDITEADLDNILKEIDIELYKQRNNVYAHLTADNTQIVQPRFIYEKKENKPGSLSTVTGKHPSSLLSHLDHIQEIQDEIMMLQGTVERLESEIDVKQESFKSELQEIGSRLNQIVCIPPMGRRSYVTAAGDAGQY